METQEIPEAQEPQKMQEPHKTQEPTEGPQKVTNPVRVAAGKKGAPGGVNKNKPKLSKLSPNTSQSE